MEIKVRENTELKNLMKLVNFVGSGGEAKHLIQNGLVKLNGEVCTIAGKKLHNGDKVEYDGEVVIISTDGN